MQQRKIMSAIVIIPPRSISSLQTARVDRTISVEKGYLNLVVGENIVRLADGDSVMVPRGTLHAVSNPSQSSAAVTDTGVGPDEATIFAEADGRVYATHRGCALQITLSLYQGLLNDLDISSACDLLEAA